MAIKSRVKTDEEYQKILGEDLEVKEEEIKTTHDASRYFDELRDSKKQNKESNPFERTVSVESLKESLKHSDSSSNVEKLKEEIAKVQTEVVEDEELKNEYNEQYESNYPSRNRGFSFEDNARKLYENLRGSQLNKMTPQPTLTQIEESKLNETIEVVEPISISQERVNKLEEAKVEQTMVNEPITKPVVEEIVKPVSEPIAKPVVEEIVKPVNESITSPVVEEVTKPVNEPIAKPDIEDLIMPVSQPTLQPMVEEIAIPEVSKPIEVESVEEEINISPEDLDKLELTADFTTENENFIEAINQSLEKKATLPQEPLFEPQATAVENDVKPHIDFNGEMKDDLLVNDDNIEIDNIDLNEEEVDEVADFNFGEAMQPIDDLSDLQDENELVELENTLDLQEKLVPLEEDNNIFAQLDNQEQFVDNDNPFNELQPSFEEEINAMSEKRVPKESLNDTLTLALDDSKSISFSKQDMETLKTEDFSDEKPKRKVGDIIFNVILVIMIILVIYFIFRTITSS